MPCWTNWPAWTWWATRGLPGLDWKGEPPGSTGVETQGTQESSWWTRRNWTSWHPRASRTTWLAWQIESQQKRNAWYKRTIRSYWSTRYAGAEGENGPEGGRSCWATRSSWENRTARLARKTKAQLPMMGFIVLAFQGWLRNPSSMKQITELSLVVI